MNWKGSSPWGFIFRADLLGELLKKEKLLIDKENWEILVVTLWFLGVNKSAKGYGRNRFEGFRSK